MARLFIIALAALPLVAADAAAQDYRSWDRNNDGVITRNEWRGTLQEFRDRDWNRDGVLSRDELRRDTRDVYADQQGTDFDALDYDGSGRIERDEWNGMRTAFNRLDVNRDGVLTRREFGANDAVVAGADDFDLLDSNNNGVISRGEWRGEYGSFNQYDLNGDGVITRREYSGASSGSYAGRGPGSITEDTIIVDARQPWTDTGIYVNAGDRVTYRADGTIQMVTGAEDLATPNGSITGRRAGNAPLPDQRAGALLMRINGGGVHFLGESGTFTAPTSGRLYLGVNDDHFPDNSGEYRVRLSVNGR